MDTISAQSWLTILLLGVDMENGGQVDVNLKGGAAARDRKGRGKGRGRHAAAFLISQQTDIFLKILFECLVLLKCKFIISLAVAGWLDSPQLLTCGDELLYGFVVYKDFT